MNALRNMKLAARLGLGFGALIAILISACVLGMVRLGDLEWHLNDIANHNDVKLAEATTMRIAVNQVALAMRELIFVDNADDMLAIQSGMEKSKGNYDAAEQRLGQLLEGTPGTLPEENAAFNKVRELKQKSAPVNMEVAGLALSHRNADATTQLMGQARPLQLQWLAALGALMDLETRLNRESVTEAEAAYTSSRYMLIAASVAGVLLGVLLAVLITRSISAPMTEAVALAHSVASGNMSATLRITGNDEATALLRAMGDMQTSLSRVVSQVRQGSENVATSSAEIAMGNNDLSARTEQQASALEQTAASMEELSSQVGHNADSARQASQLAASACSVATAGGEVVSRVVQTMKEINTSSQRIADIIGVIDGIAFQTNILALNAAVEAARAGEQGRGFAVVATEVRSLAGRSAAAAKEIKTLINASVERVELGSTLVDQAGATMHEVVTSIRRVTDIVAEISLASSEQAAGVAQVGEAIQQMDQVTQQNAALVEEMAAAAVSLKSQAQDLVGTVAVFVLDAASARTGQPALDARAQPALDVSRTGKLGYSVA